MAQTNKGKALERLQKLLDKIPELRRLRFDSPRIEGWRRSVRNAVADTFGNESNHIRNFERVPFFGDFIDESGSEYQSGPEYQEDHLENLQYAVVVLESAIDEINEYWEDESGTSRSSDSHNNGQINTKEVFIVHGRDEGAREKVARFLERLGLKPVVLHEQPNEGRTIIEKFEDFAYVGFAVVLLTPDDVGKLRDNEGDPKPRARQNVIFEFGYFIGQLGRKRVCALVKGDVERPSDYDGVLYIPLDDSGGWEMRLIQELKSAGYDIDANRAFAT